VKINDIQIDGFGVWKGLEAEGLAADITVFYGQNEAGKTTLMEFVRSSLFGFSPERREKYVPPVHGGLAGGSLFVTCPSGQYEIQRHVDPNRHADPAGDLTLIENANGDVHGNAQLATILSNIDESIYNNVFAVGLREIQELNALNNTQAADHLYRLTSGLDRVSLVDVMRDTANRREQIWSNENSASGGGSRLTTLHRKRLALQHEVEDLRLRSRRWSRIAAQSREAQVKLEEREQRIRELERELRLLEVAIQISDRWSRRGAISAQIDSFGMLPEPHEISVSSLDELNDGIARQQEKISQIAQQRRKLRKEAQSMNVDRTVWSQRNRIEALVSHSPWIESLQKTANAISAEVDSVTGAASAEVEGLGGRLKLKSRDIELIAERNLGTLKANARELAEHQERVNGLKDEAEKCRFELTQHEKSLGDAFSETAGTIPDSLEDTSRNVNRLRRRIELEEKIEKLQRNQADLEREVDNVVEDQVLPVGKIAIIGAVFVIGAMMAMTGMFGTIWPELLTRTGLAVAAETAQNVGFTMMLFGTVFGLIALAVKYHWERVARENLEDFRHQMEMVRQQLKRAKTERDEIDRLLPGFSGQWDLNLKDAEQRLGRLEDLMPMENRTKSSRIRLEEIRRQISSQERELEACEKKWQAGLRAIGLPENLAPAQVREISQRSSRIASYNVRLESLRGELALREKELADVAVRIEELARETGLQITVSKKRPLEALTLLKTALSEQRRQMVHRKELQIQYKKLQKVQSRASRELDSLLGQHTKLLAGVGVTTEEEYRQFDLKHAQRNTLIVQRDQLGEQIAAALGKHVAEMDVKPLLDEMNLTGLEKKWEATGSETDSVRKEHTKLLQQRGEFVQEIKSLGEDNKLDLKSLELNCVDQEIANLQDEWQVLASTSQMLEAIREGYESKRQPETLREASGYLEQLTDGRYKRIWTRMTGEELLVDHGDEETITVDKLSRGTREAVYLSLRLALISVYARRGALLPLILDDILVNFDAVRSHRAAEVLMQFARNGYQILMFTCHDHMRDMFHELGADVRILPHHRDVLEHQAKPVPWGVEATEPVTVSVPVPQPVAVTVLGRRESLAIDTEEFDSELEFELSRIDRDQNQSRPLRTHLVYQDEALGERIPLPADQDKTWHSVRSNRQSA